MKSNDLEYKIGIHGLVFFWNDEEWAASHLWVFVFLIQKLKLKSRSLVKLNFSWRKYLLPTRSLKRDKVAEGLWCLAE